MFNLKNFLDPVNISRIGGKKRGKRVKNKTKRKMMKKGGWQVKSKTRTRRRRTRKKTINFKL